MSPFVAYLGEQRVVLRGSDDLDRALAARYLAGATMQQLGDELGVTRETVRLRLRRVGADQPKVSRAERHRERDECIISLYRQGLTLQAVAAQVGLAPAGVRRVLMRNGVPRRSSSDRVGEHTRTCRVCGERYRGSKRSATCSSRCAEAWKVLRRYLDAEEYEKHRLCVARNVLGHPEKHAPARIDLARRVVAGDAPPPNRRFLVPDSRAAKFAAALGVEIPLSSARHRRNPYRCAARNRNGTECSRTVADEGAVCHVHAGAMRRAS